jgi:hypothetical protein
MRAITILSILCIVSFTAAADWTVLDTGAVGDGVFDNTAAIQQALDKAAESGGGVVQMPAGRFRINGNLVIPRAVTLQGIFNAPPTDRGGRPLQLDGTVLLAYTGRGSREGDPFLRLGGEMAAVRGLTIHYPEWKQDDVPPVPYPPAIGAHGVNDVAIENVLIVNAYEGIHFTLTARFVVRNVFGYPSYRGLYVDECYDIGRVENCHFWPFGVLYQPEDPYCKWVNVEGVAFEFARTDWQYVLNTFCFGYGVGYKFSKTEAGACNGNFLGIGADSCRRAVLVEESQEPGLLITNGEFVGRWSSVDSITIEVAEESSAGKVSLVNCSFWGPIERCIWLRSPRTQLTANACHFVHFDNNAVGAPAIQLDRGKAILQGNTFGEGDTHVLVAEDVRSAIIMGNQAPAGLIVENQAGDRTQLVANELNPIKWTEVNLCHYTIDIGAPGDGAYVRAWHGAEGVDEHSMRWSTEGSILRLPVRAGQAYTLTLEAHIPAAAIAPEAGIYLGETLLAALPEEAGNQAWSVTIPPQEGDRIELAIRPKLWVPAQVNPESKDNRTLGIRVGALTMMADCAGEEIFNANMPTE